MGSLGAVAGAGSGAGAGPAAGSGAGKAQQGGKRGTLAEGASGHRSADARATAAAGQARKAVLSAAVAQALPPAPAGEAGDSLPATWVWLAGLGVLGAALAGGFFLYRRGLP